MYFDVPCGVKLACDGLSDTLQCEFGSCVVSICAVCLVCVVRVEVGYKGIEGDEPQDRRWRKLG